LLAEKAPAVPAGVLALLSVALGLSWMGRPLRDGSLAHDCSGALDGCACLSGWPFLAGPGGVCGACGGDGRRCVCRRPHAPARWRPKESRAADAGRLDQESRVHESFRRCPHLLTNACGAGACIASVRSVVLTRSVPTHAVGILVSLARR
jgi:hypothetical protein